MLADGVWMRRQDCAFENCVWPMVLAREFCAVVNSQKKKKTRKDAAVAAVQRKTNKRKREKAEKNKTVRRWIASAI